MKYRFLSAITAVYLSQLNCVRTRYICPPSTEDDADCKPEGADKVKFRQDRPDLPTSVTCMSDPLAQKASSFRISSHFLDPDHCFTPGEHHAIDIPAEAGTPVVAPAAGKVVRVVAGHGSAWQVDVLFGIFWTYTVVHLREIAVVEGEDVLLGQVLGWSGGEVGKPGSGPYTTGAHLHFSMQYDDAFVDPEKYLCRTYPRSTGKMTCPEPPKKKMCK